MTDHRLCGLTDWLSHTLQIAPPALQPVSGDASFRRYFRFRYGATSRIAVDAPPQTEKNRQFMQVAAWLADEQLRVPAVYQADTDAGWLCLEDLGDRLLFDELNERHAPSRYQEALTLLLRLQRASRPAWLEAYDQALIERENALFPEWFVEGHLGLTLTPAERTLWDQVCRLLTENHLQQPQVVMHRDFHSRNLMRVGDQLALLDFQDMVWGPISYDLVSLLRDCYIAWPPGLVDRLLTYYREQARLQGLLPAGVGADQFRRWFDWSGMQRHLKAIGIFARLSQRDGKHRYLHDIPRTLGYVREVAGRYTELQPFSDWLCQRMPPQPENLL